MMRRGAGWLRAASIAAACAACVATAHAADVESLRRAWLDLLAREPHVLAPRRTRAAEAAVEGVEAALRRDPHAAIDAKIAAAERAIAVADSAIATARTTFAAALAARAAARALGAPAASAAAWRAAEGLLAAAAEKLEVGRRDAAGRQAAAAQARFEELRFATLRGDVLAEVQAGMQRLEALDARRWVPRSSVRASDATTTAEQLLRARGQADAEVQRAVTAAAAEVRHAQYLLERIRGACEKGDAARLESSVLDWEAALARTLQAAGLTADFGAGLGPALEALEVRTTTLVRERDAERAYSGSRSAAAESLRTALAALADTLRARDAELADLRRWRAKQARFDDLQALLDRDEGRVLRVGPDVVLRLQGLVFAPGAATLPEAAAPLLDKVVRALAAFPGARIVVEGHTDAQGRAEANQLLSQQRAEAVRAWLVERAALAPALVTAVGYGAARPVAAETDEMGRAANRRIEIVIAPVD
jgi:outer membrane protein OmpA-like peptidoglycan-associated protein